MEVKKILCFTNPKFGKHASILVTNISLMGQCASIDPQELV